LSAEAASQFVAQLADGHLIEIPGAGHHIMIDQPDRLLVALENFIATTELRKPDSD
jgi:pimeloyl-ACP methyl ester carboxylesterase